MLPPTFAPSQVDCEAMGIGGITGDLAMPVRAETCEARNRT